jgi:transposase
MPNLATWLEERHGVKADPSNLSKLLCRAGFTFKKNTAGIGTRTRRRAPGARGVARTSSTRDATEPRTSRFRGRDVGQDQHDTAAWQEQKGQAPAGGCSVWQMAHPDLYRRSALRCPYGSLVDGAMDGDKFDTYVRTQLAPTLEPGDVVIWDNLNVRKSPRAAAAIAERKAWILSLPRYSPDNNPIEMAFSKLKTLLRKMKARTYDDLWKAVGKVCDLFTPQECWNYFRQAGCAAH